MLPPSVGEPRDKRLWAEQVLKDVLGLLTLPARLELKDAPDGGISIAVFFEQEPAGVQVGRRSQLIDSLQFLLNKIVNRPQTERRWITLGVGAHPGPRTPAVAVPERPARPAPVAKAAAPVGPPRPPAPAHAIPVRAPAATGAGPVDEFKLEVPVDLALASAAKRLAEKSAQLGRFYAVVPMKVEDRARFVQAVAAVSGTGAKVEGEGRNRRVVLVPDRPVPMPKKVIADYGDDEG